MVKRNERGLRTTGKRRNIGRVTLLIEGGAGMIQMQSVLKSADNTAKELMCIKYLAVQRKYANIGDTIVCSVKMLHPAQG